MFCHQCQETAKNQACVSKKGTCGKTDDVANLQDLFIFVLQGIATWAIKGAVKETVKGKAQGIGPEAVAPFIHRGLFATITNADFSKTNFLEYIEEGLRLRDSLQEQVLSAGGRSDESLPACATWAPKDRDDILRKAESGECGWQAVEDEDIRSLRSLVLYGLKGISAYAEHAHQLGHANKEIAQFTLEAMAAIADGAADEMTDADALLELVLETGRMGVEVMALLDKANTLGYGEKEISQVELGVRENPGILVSGHDLKDLEDLLEQTKGAGVDVYTHSEMLPAHFYPKFKTYENLVGNYGGAWYLQEKEFEQFNGPVLLTSNCLVPPKKPEQRAKIFTTGAVGFEGCPHIPDREAGKQKDFSAIIEMAKTCPPPAELETGQIVGGFGHQQVMKLADKVIDAVQAGKIKRFIVLAGCDARHHSRSYYTQVAEKLPKDTVILTAGCAKFRYNKLDLGDIDGIPRILDAGQCNDCYSLAAIAMGLQKAFGLDDINQLPISYDIAWYEQKATLVLLALLYLGVKGMRLGPTLPGFLSPGVAKILVEKFDIKGITTPEADVKAMMGP